MTGIDMSQVQTPAQRLAKAQKKRKAQEAAIARANAARAASVRTTAPAATQAAQQSAADSVQAPATTPATTTPARSEAQGIRQRFSNVVKTTQGARNQVIDKAVADSVAGNETGRGRMKKIKINE